MTDDRRRSVIFLTTPTSGSQSIWRVLSALLVPPMASGPVLPENGAGPKDPSFFEPFDHLYLLRNARYFDEKLYSDDFDYVVNFRDPRDMLCNQYYWLTQHPVAANHGEAKVKELTAERLARFEEGIDKSVLRSNVKVFDPIKAIANVAGANPKSRILFISYAQLCCAFPAMVSRIQAFLDVEPNDRMRAKIALEAPENLDSNPKWIGQRWVGTDIEPGRFRHELAAETISTLTERFASTLDLLKALDLPELAHTYE